jgi:hypothetical protein
VDKDILIQQLSRQYKQAVAELNDRDPFCNSSKNLGLDNLRSLKDNYSSVSTVMSTQNRKMTIEYDKIKSEKTEMEESLVFYKFRYAEESSKRMDIEDKLSALTYELKKTEKNLIAANEALKYKDDIIDQLIKQKEDLNKKCRTKKHTYSVVINNNIAELDNKSIANDSSFCSEAKYKSPISTRIKPDNTPNTSRLNPYEDTSPVNKKKGISGFMKNLFK